MNFFFRPSHINMEMAFFWKLIKYGELSLGEIVANDFRAASLFSKAGIDFCCGGKKTLHQACNEKSLNPEGLEIELNELHNQPVASSQDFNNWNIAFLADYIVKTHHLYVVKTLPELVFYTQKIATVHGPHHWRGSFQRRSCKLVTN